MPRADPKPVGPDRWRVRVYIDSHPVTGKQITRTYTYEAKEPT